MDERLYQYVFGQVLSMTDDGFIVVDKNGLILEINQQYSDFFGKTPEELIGKSILEIIPNSKMLEIMENKSCDEGVIHQYLEGTTKEKTVIVSRTYVEDDKGEVVAGVAQVKFRLGSLDVAKKLMQEYTELAYYKEHYQENSQHPYSFEKIIGSSPAFKAKKKEGAKAAKTNFPVLLTGETGTGKEVFARAIHNRSSRSQRAMVSINCAAIPMELLESELFGYMEGSFTGAKKGGKKGKFLVANTGTLFLDEIGDLPLSMQGKLLRVLQENEIEPIGSLEAIPIDVRIIAATRKNLPQMIEKNLFREDLFYRLNVINLQMIPLRERKEDVVELAEYFLHKLNLEYDTIKELSAEVKNCFFAYNWPGNVRELDNVIKSAYAISDNRVIHLEDLPSKMAMSSGDDFAETLCSNFLDGRYESNRKARIGKSDKLFEETLRPLQSDHIQEQSRAETSSADDFSEAPTSLDDTKTIHDRVNEFEKELIHQVMVSNRWNCQKAAKQLGIHRSLLYKKITKYSLRPE